MVRTAEEILEMLRTRIGEDNSDEAIALIEDISDTLNANDGENWKKKYEENDASWRKKYRDRFFSGETKTEEDEEIEEEDKTLTYEKLFKED